ncbi:hypothetical protein GOQ27_12975 [Clostridium sp. D2Q-11]|uniref:Uncharacterized protein n=1 Tax=Anaeromonas frigoriresistens TaxID=2683708 RepID=A0A942V1C8_9FIRM|nr:hypothetical protein [Anaeromonas frigoriresistens]MBS4539382.1 hypothetical protein [Anaeromonas frigoriresistens]
MKRKLLSLSLMVFMLAVMFAPVYAASSTGYWSFTMNYRVVDGDANGEFYDLTAGDMSLSGDVYAYSKDGGAVSSPYTIYFSVKESKDWSIDRSVGSTSRTPSSTLYSSRSVSGSWGEQPAGKYYLVIYTVEDDGWNTKGSGTLKNN